MAPREAELTRREGELSPREEELRRREGQVQQLEKEQAIREEQLAAREGRVAKDEATYAERHEKANADFAAKQKRIQEEADAKVDLIRQNLAKDYDAKATKQEERFTKKRNELQHRIEGLEKEEKETASRLKRAKEAQARAEKEAAALKKDMGEFHQQVGPVADLVEEAKRNAQIGRTMSRQRQRML